MPTITINDFRDVLVDGINLGHVVDVVRSVPPRADPSEVKGAFDMWFVGYHRTHMEALAQAVAAKDAAARESARKIEEMNQARIAANSEKERAYKSAIAQLNSAHKQQMEAMKAAHKLQIDAMKADIATLEADLATLGTKPEAQAMREKQRRAALVAELAAIDARSVAPEPADGNA